MVEVVVETPIQELSEEVTAAEVTTLVMEIQVLEEINILVKFFTKIKKKRNHRRLLKKIRNKIFVFKVLQI
jgi:hypothetical protein